MKHINKGLVVILTLTFLGALWNDARSREHLRQTWITQEQIRLEMEREAEQRDALIQELKEERDALVELTEEAKEILGWEMVTMEVTGYAPLDPNAVEGMCYSGDPSITASGAIGAIWY